MVRRGDVGRILLRSCVSIVSWVTWCVEHPHMDTPGAGAGAGAGGAILHDHLGGRTASAEEMTGWNQPAGSLSVLSHPARTGDKDFYNTFLLSQLLVYLYTTCNIFLQERNKKY